MNINHEGFFIGFLTALALASLAVGAFNYFYEYHPRTTRPGYGAFTYQEVPNCFMVEADNSSQCWIPVGGKIPYGNVCANQIGDYMLVFRTELTPPIHGNQTKYEWYSNLPKYDWVDYGQGVGQQPRD